MFISGLMVWKKCLGCVRLCDVLPASVLSVVLCALCVTVLNVWFGMFGMVGMVSR